VSFLHLPVQSGSDRVLNLMGRTHTALEYKAIIRKLRAARLVQLGVCRGADQLCICR